MEHHPVLLEEVLSLFRGRKLRRFVDGTLGLGGHAKALLEEHPELEQLVGIDQDGEARALAAKRLAEYGERVEIVAGNFASVALGEADGILLDIGVSSMQIDCPERGFSFMHKGPLDMRMNPEGTVTAADIVNGWPEEELAKLLRDGEVRSWRRIASQIVAARPLETTEELAELLPFQARPVVFQALRMAVNDELGVLERAIPRALAALRKGGRLAIITFHSLEDRQVKNAFKAAAQDWEEDPTFGRRKKEAAFVLVTPRPIVAGAAEVAVNPRARSAKLRAVERR